MSPPQPSLSIRSLHIARSLRHVGDVEVVLVDSLCEGLPAADLLSEEFKCFDGLTVQAESRGLSARLRRRLDARYALPHGLGVSAGGERQFLGLLSRFDLVWVFKLRTANVFRFSRWPNSVLDVDDLPSGVYETLARSDRPLLGRLGAWIESHNWQRRERLLGERFSVIAVCSDTDAAKLNVSVPVHVIPNGSHRTAQVAPRRQVTPPRVGFIGLFDHEPNIDGVRWFMRHCWPRVASEVPGARFRLVGRRGDTVFADTRPDVDVLGWIPDVDAEIATWSLMVVPLFVGGGTRVKIAEGFSQKCPIVSTTVGAYGYEVESGQDLFLSDDAEGFSAACVTLLRDPSFGDAMAERAHRKYIQRWTWDAIAPRVWAAAEDGLRARSANASSATHANQRMG